MLKLPFPNPLLFWLMIFLAATIINFSPLSNAEDAAKPLTVKWLGQACLYIQAPDGTRIVTDPYGPGLPYAPPAVEADLVTISHSHSDHNAPDRVKGTPMVINTITATPKTVGMVTVTGFPSFHDDVQGAKRGPNIIFQFTIGNYRIVHLGDLGAIPAPEVIQALKGADLVFAPVGEVFTMPVEEVVALTEMIQAKTVVPMHYSIAKDKPLFGLLTVDKYLNTLKPGTKVRNADHLVVENGFPNEVVVLATWKPE